MEPAETAALNPTAAAAVRKRPRPGERRAQILQCLAGMLEEGGAERITTAALAQRLQVSEAALYRHFASKAQMFDALIDFIESSVFGLINQIAEHHDSGLLQAQRTVQALLAFAERNPGLCRLLAGGALAGEHARLQQRVDRFLERVEAALRASLRLALQQQALAFDPAQRAQWLMTYADGCLWRVAHRRGAADADGALLALLA
ncbi:nucleoid occlusion factor SlmA [mine drainage metagenome]|jgi:TetR/AcrR family transcriptional regulator|uniref:Nucleoid occlusion factor SlmA n=1 Tax=mine drainage metagenome TaxID=410659 RepID=A0A1J5QSQ3_9ZZZZ